MNLSNVVALVVQLVQAGSAIAGPVEAAVKTIIQALAGAPLTDAEIDAAFAQVLADDLVIQAKAQAQSGDGDPA